MARKTRESMLVFEAAGFDTVIVETVGVGQSETAVASMTDFFLVLILAGAGDELQGIKKGVLEAADALAVNKADGENYEKAMQAVKEYQKALHFLVPASPNWSPPVLACSATEGTGLKEIWDTILEHRKAMGAGGELGQRRRRQALHWMWTLVEEGLKERFDQNPGVRKLLPQLKRDVEAALVRPMDAAQRLLSVFDENPRV